MRDLLTKSDWLMAQQCPCMAWYALRAAPEPPDEAARFRMLQGHEVGAQARQLFPEGRLVEGANMQAAAAVTQEQIREGHCQTLFEAAFMAAPFAARADVLTRVDGGWHVLEVKSAFSDTDRGEDLTDDLAYTVMVCERAGVPVMHASLVLLSRDFRFGEDVGRLFEVVDRSDEALARARVFQGTAEGTAKALFREAPPGPRLVAACRGCAAFDECLGNGLAHTVLELPGLRRETLERLSADGIVDLALWPDEVELTDTQQRARQSALSNELAVETGLGASLASIQWPCHYLDFETVAAVLPLYPGHGCHQQVCTQFSLHSRDSIATEPRHTEYLADATRDCERELAETLIRALGQAGSVVVYSGFESTRIKALQTRFPDLASPLGSILARVVDLLPIIRTHVYHPAFGGSFSIKAVLPALVPELSYKSLAIRNGDMAISRFAQMARREIAGSEFESVRRQLLDYCRMDTLAMVRLHEALVTLATT